MRQVGWVFATMLLAGCVEDEVVTRPTPVTRAVELTTVEAPAGCRALGGVEVRSGDHDPTSHEQLRVLAEERGANYVVLDAFGVLPCHEDILAVTRARLFQCPLPLLCYRCAAPTVPVQMVRYSTVPASLVDVRND